MKTIIHIFEKNNFENNTTKTRINFTSIAIGSFFLSLFFVGCSSTDSTPVAPIYSFVSIHSANANTAAGDCNSWDLVYEAPGFSVPDVKRTDSFAPDLLFSKVRMSQCSAYNKLTQTLLIGIGDRIVKYQYGPTFASATPVATPPIVYLGSTVQAIEYIGTRLFIIKNNILSEYDPVAITPLATFTPITIASGAYISNLTSLGTKLYFIANDKLYGVDTTLSRSALVTIASGLLPAASGVYNYDGLEVKDATTFYAINNNTSASISTFVKITSSGIISTEITGLPTGTIHNRLSSAYDYTTEFYYGVSYDQSTNTSSIYTIDITPLSGPLTVSSVPVSGYTFGLQLLD